MVEMGTFPLSRASLAISEALGARQLCRCREAGGEVGGEAANLVVDAVPGLGPCETHNWFLPPIGLCF